MNFDYLDKILNTYPYPITGILCRIGAPECMKLHERPRLDCILDTADAAVRFLAVLTLCILRDHVEETGNRPPGLLAEEIAKHLKRPSGGHWLFCAREGLRWLNQQSLDSVLASHLSGFFFQNNKPSNASLAAEHLLSVRNDVAHKRRSASDPREIKTLCEETYSDLTLIIEGLEFLANYNLSYIHEIEVAKRRRQEPDFRHSLLRLRVTDGAFRGSSEIYTSPLESSSVIFRQGNTATYLNLDPLLVYEYPPQKPRERTRKSAQLASAGAAAADLFFFNGMKTPDAMEYVACKHGGIFNSSASERAIELAEEMEALLSALVEPVELVNHGS